jgi:hypothetical protein
MSMKCQEKTPLDYYYTLFNKGQEDKAGHLQGWTPVGGGGHDKRVTMVGICCAHI